MRITSLESFITISYIGPTWIHILVIQLFIFSELNSASFYSFVEANRAWKLSLCDPICYPLAHQNECSIDIWQNIYQNKDVEKSSTNGNDTIAKKQKSKHKSACLKRQNNQKK